MNTVMASAAGALRETVERLRASAALDSRASRHVWLDVLGMTHKQYQDFLQGQRELPEKSIESLAAFLQISPEEIRAGSVDYRSVAIRWENGGNTLPERYSVAAFARRRTAIASFDYIEKQMGWRTRHEVVRRLGVNEAVFSDLMAPINLRIMTDTIDCLHSRHGLMASDFFRMGAHSAAVNRGTLVGDILSATSSPAEAYQIFLTELIGFFEQNTKYTIVRLTNERCTVDVLSYPYVAEALSCKHLGNWGICALKGGILSTIPIYAGWSAAKVTEHLCVHRGDSVCRYEVVFPTSKSS